MPTSSAATASSSSVAAAAAAAAPAADTAAVLEFRCLFSRDGHKKRKKFHDGTLKFHAFNARVMVYDLDRHYIGDLHYRQDDAFDEGLEFRLDCGVVVQVQDRVGQTLTPLDQVLGCKSKTTPGSSKKQAARPNPVASQQRPRSLKDVLAASQRATGLRRPAPRPLPLLPPSNQAAPPPRKKLKSTHAPITKEAPIAKDMAIASLPSTEVFDLSSDDEPPRPQQQRQQQQQQQQQKQQQQPGKLPAQTSPRPRPRAALAKSPRPPCPKVRLGLPPQKPRPKLMYRALLARPAPGSDVPSPPRQSDQCSPVEEAPSSPPPRPASPNTLGAVDSAAGTVVVCSPPRPASRHAPASPQNTSSASALGRDAPAHAGEEEKSGPWTRQEAFLLFDWWPAGRKKPEYGVCT